MGDKSDIYEQALAGKRVPVLTLDNNWYKLFTDLAELPRIQEKEKQLNELVQRQGQLNVDSKNIKKLKKKKTYYFRVRAYRLEGTKKVYGAWSNMKKIKIKK